jgi:Holliday junction resolvase
MSTIAHAEKAVEAIKGLNEFLKNTDGDMLLVGYSFSDEHLLNYGEARKIVKDNKYNMLLIHNVVTLNRMRELQHDYKIFKPNDKTILKDLAIEVNTKSFKHDDDLIYVDGEELVKFSAKFTARLIVIIKKLADTEGLVEDDREILIDVLKVLKKNTSTKKTSTKKGAVDAEKLADAKAHAKDLKKIATDAKKAADVAEKNYEKAEAVVAKLLSK